MRRTDEWFTIKDAGQIDTPALVIYPQRVKENIRILKNMIGDPGRLRPHVKTHKTKEATRLMMDAGIHKFKCATIAEAEMLGQCKAKDVLLAYPVLGPKLQRYINLIKRYPDTRFSGIIDNKTAAVHISKEAIRNKMVIDVFIDLNVGMDRTGILPGERAIQLYEDCMQLNGIRMAGLHAYDGHIKETDIQKRTRAVEASFAPVMAMRQKLEKKGHAGLTMIFGGSPTFRVHARHQDVECSPGTFVFWDQGYLDLLPEQQFLPAALVVTRVISLPDKTRLCLDLGHKSIAAENDLNYRVRFLNAPGLKAVKQSEEHLVLEVPEGHPWKPGDVWYGLPTHICPTCALYESATTIEAGEFTGTWKIIARDRKIGI